MVLDTTDQAMVKPRLFHDLKNLRAFLSDHVPENVETRIIMTNFDNTRYPLPGDLIDYLGSTFSITDPSLFQATIWAHAEIDRILGKREATRRPLKYRKTSEPPIFLGFEDMFWSSAIRKEHRPKQDFNIILIFTTTNFWDNWRKDAYRRITTRRAEKSSLNPVDFSRHAPAAVGLSKFYRQLAPLREKHYKMMNKDPYRYVLSLIRNAIYLVETDTQRISNLYSYRQTDQIDDCVRGLYEALVHAYRRRDDLRDLLLATEGAMGDDCQKNKEMQDTGKAVIEDAERLEHAINTALQVGITQRSAEEQSLVKYLTILAFIFLPLSFATSIFGMNLDNLNGTGPKAWVFGIVLGCIVLVSAFAFGLAYWYPRAKKRADMDLV